MWLNCLHPCFLRHLLLLQQQATKQEGVLSKLTSNASYLPVSAKELELLAGVVNAFQSHIFLRYQIRAIAKLFTSLIFLFGPMMASFTESKELAGYEETDLVANPTYLHAGLTFFVVDVMEWAGLTFGIHYRSTKNIHEKVDLYRQLVFKAALVPFLIIVCASLSGVFMFNVIWNPVEPKTLSKKLAEIAEGSHFDSVVIPRKCSALEAALPIHNSCFPDAQWNALKLRTDFYGDDSSMWIGNFPGTDNSPASPQFRIANPSFEDAAAGFIYPLNKEQTLGTYFYRYLLEQCS